MAHIGLNPTLAQELAYKIFDNIDENGVEELRALADLLSGNVSVENYIAGAGEGDEEEA